MSLESSSVRHPDAVVIGGGIIGSSIALRLAQAGLRVTVFDRGRAGAEASSAAAGMIAPQAEKTGPPEFDDLCRASHSLYPEFAAEMEALSGQAANYRRDGTLLLALDEEQERELDRIEAGAVERLDAEAARRQVPGLAADIRRALFLPGDHSVDNKLLTRAVIEAARRQGVIFEENAPVRRIVVRHDRAEGIEADRGRVAATEVILAAGCWSGALAATAGVEIPMDPCRGQMLEFELASALPVVVRAGHHYLVPRAGDAVIVGTTAEYAGFEATVTAAGLASVLQAALRLAPFLAAGRFRRAWAGLRPDTADHLPVLGRSGIGGLTLATGHFRNGILLAPVTARLIADLVVGGAAPAALEPFRADRFALAAARS
ncbi:MAG TPA: glycine oxidase ThiO [Terriglobia bacterium]|jgi:glycine oxidase|nr:glycine oxidase ThiO [Terriglobia bacterium]